jgi:hypothetical protein
VAGNQSCERGFVTRRGEAGEQRAVALQISRPGFDAVQHAPQRGAER